MNPESEPSAPSASDPSAVFRRWVGGGGTGSEDELEGYFGSIAQARFVLRRLFRIFNEEAKHEGLEGLQHQALIQIAGHDQQEGLPVGRLARRLDVSLALASRMVAQLHKVSLVERGTHPADGRVTVARATPEGREALARISQRVHAHMHRFQDTLTEEERRAALLVLTFQLGITLDDEAAGLIEALLVKARSGAQGS